MCAEVGMRDISDRVECAAAATKLGLMDVDAGAPVGGGCRAVAVGARLRLSAVELLCVVEASPCTPGEDEHADAVAASATGAAGLIESASATAGPTVADANSGIDAGAAGGEAGASSGATGASLDLRSG